MTPLLQQIVALFLVAGAASYLALRWRRRRTAAQCDGCHTPRTVRTRTGVRPRALRVLD
jgi:hypothetical protein